jgi:hypothetical protein
MQKKIMEKVKQKIQETHGFAATIKPPKVVEE